MQRTKKIVVFEKEAVGTSRYYITGGFAVYIGHVVLLG
jgi:hypothetical protein